MDCAKLGDMDSTTTISFPAVEQLLAGNVLALLPVVDSYDTLDENGDPAVDFAPGVLVVHLGDQLEPRLTWIGSTEVFAGMTARSEQYSTATAAHARAVELAGWAEVGV